MRGSTRLIALAAVAATPLAWAGSPQRLVVFVFDQTLKAILRVEDKNLDGDTLDPGEVTRYFDSTTPGFGTGNSQGLVALGPNDLLATDNFDPDDIVRLRDLNGDGDAFDTGEYVEWFNGIVPGGTHITNPTCLEFGPNGSFVLDDNNTLDSTVQEAVYLLKDNNSDGDVNDPGEVVTHFVLSPAGVSQTTTFEAIFDDAGACYVFDITDPNQIEHIDRINPGATAKTQWLRSTTLLNLAGLVFGTSFKLEHDPMTDELIAAASDLSNRVYLIALKDRNGTNSIDQANEIRVLWTEGLNADGLNIGVARDFTLAADRSIVFVDSGTDVIVRLFDLNDDGDYNDLGETRVIYSAATAGAAGQQSATQLLSVATAVVPPCPADLDGDGSVGASDLAILLGSWGGGGPADFDGGGVGASDLAILLGSWGPCP